MRHSIRCEGGRTTQCSGIGIGGATCAVGHPMPLTWGESGAGGVGRAPVAETTAEG